jgi:hypothetical protein
VQWPAAAISGANIEAGAAETTASGFRLPPGECGVLKKAVRTLKQIYGRYQGPKKNRPELRDGKFEPVNVLERIMEEIVMLRIEKRSKDDYRGNPDFLVGNPW